MTENEIDKLSIEKAKELFYSGKISEIEIGTMLRTWIIN